MRKPAISTGNLKTLARRVRAGMRSPISCAAAAAFAATAISCTTTCSRAARSISSIESDLNILDIAPLVLIVREAGGVFTDLDGRDIGLDDAQRTGRSARAARAGWRFDRAIQIA